MFTIKKQLPHINVAGMMRILGILTSSILLKMSVIINTDIAALEAAVVTVKAKPVGT